MGSAPLVPSRPTTQLRLSKLSQIFIIMGSKNGKPVLTEQQAEQLAQSSGLDVVQVREQFDAFVLEHPNGKMKKKDFREMMAKALPKKDAGKMEKHVFRIYDTNNDGYIDFPEFMIVFYIMSDGPPEEVLGKIFRVFDVNSDGSINKKELTRLIKDMYGLINNDNPEEASKELITNTAFAEMDKDEDGKVTMDEFIAACMSQEEFSKMLALKIINIFIEEDN